MAKKVVATLRKAGSKNLAKFISCVRSQKTGAYTFKEEIVTLEKAKELMTKKH
jgi:hypothetical protein